MHRSRSFFTDILSGKLQKSFFQAIGLGDAFQFGSSALSDDFPMIDDGDPISYLFRFFHIMGREKYGNLLFFIQMLDVFPDMIPRLRIQS